MILHIKLINTGSNLQKISEKSSQFAVVKYFHKFKCEIATRKGLNIFQLLFFVKYVPVNNFSLAHSLHWSVIGEKRSVSCYLTELCVTQALSCEHVIKTMQLLSCSQCHTNNGSWNKYYARHSLLWYLSTWEDWLWKNCSNEIYNNQYYYNSWWCPHVQLRNFCS